MKTLNAHGIAVGLLLAASAPAVASDFGLEYDVERVPTAQLSLADCAAAVRRASEEAGYVMRTEHDQGKLVLHVSGPAGEGSALVGYCIQAGTRTVWVVQVLDYEGAGNAASAAVMKAVAAELRSAAGLGGSD